MTMNADPADMRASCGDPVRHTSRADQLHPVHHGRRPDAEMRADVLYLDVGYSRPSELQIALAIV
jgi:hypothetical protein